MRLGDVEKDKYQDTQYDLFISINILHIMMALSVNVWKIPC